MSDLRYAVGVDVGGTKVAAAVVDSNGTILRKVKLATDRQDRDRSVAQVALAAREAVAGAGLEWERIAAVGVDIPGIYYPKTGKVWAPNCPAGIIFRCASTWRRNSLGRWWWTATAPPTYWASSGWAPRAASATWSS